MQKHAQLAITGLSQAPNIEKHRPRLKGQRATAPGSRVRGPLHKDYYDDQTKTTTNKRGQEAFCLMRAARHIQLASTL